MAPLIRHLARFLGGMLLLSALGPAHAAPAEYELKAAFIYQIARFVEWPPSGRSLRLCVLGDNPFGAALDTIRDRQVGNRKLEVALLEMNADTRGCAMLFVASTAERHIERIAALSRGAGMLTIGDTPGFAERGLAINFFLEGGKVRFEINPDAAQHAGLKISSQVLKLARIARGGAP